MDKTYRNLSTFDQFTEWQLNNKKGTKLQIWLWVCPNDYVLAENELKNTLKKKKQKTKQNNVPFFV